MKMTKEDYYICASLAFCFNWAGGHYWYTKEKSKAWTNLIIGVFIAPCTFCISTLVMMIIGIVKGIQFLSIAYELARQEREQLNNKPYQIYQPQQQYQQTQQQQYQQYQPNYNQQSYQQYQQYQPPNQQSYYQQYQQQNTYNKKDS